MNTAVYERLTDMLAACADMRHTVQAVVNAPFAFKMETTELSLGIIVLLVADKRDGMVHRIALSETELANSTREISVKRFEDIKIPLEDPHNLIAKTIRTGKPQHTTDWHYLFVPALTAEEARLNQAGGAISTSFIYPLEGVGDGAAMIFSYYEYITNITDRHQDFMLRYSRIAAQHLRAFTPEFRTLYA